MAFLNGSKLVPSKWLIWPGYGKGRWFSRVSEHPFDITWKNEWMYKN